MTGLSRRFCRRCQVDFAAAAWGGSLYRSFGMPSSMVQLIGPVGPGLCTLDGARPSWHHSPVILGSRGGQHGPGRREIACLRYQR